jgi:hypothetical protein
MSHITDKANAGSVSTSQYLPPFFRTHPHRTHPESSRQCGWKASAARPLSGGMKDVSFPIAVGPIYHRNGEREVTAT